MWINSTREKQKPTKFCMPFFPTLAMMSLNTCSAGWIPLQVAHCLRDWFWMEHCYIVFLTINILHITSCMLICKVLHGNILCYSGGFDNKQAIEPSVFLNPYSIFLIQVAGLSFDLCLHLMIFMLFSAVLSTPASKMSDYSRLLLTWTNHVTSKVSTTATLLGI